MDKDLEKRCVFSKKHEIKLTVEYEKSQRILDIGGGGEGIIGKLYGKNVVAIDKLANELYETDNESLKIEMDASDMSFINDSFDVVTVFFTFLYMPPDMKLSVLKECFRVLKNNGIIEIWDIFVPEFEEGKKDVFVADLEVILPGEKIKAQYGALLRKQAQTEKQISQLCEKVGMKQIHSSGNNAVFHLAFQKQKNVT